MFEIRPFEGLGPISFGMKRDQVIEILGEPDDQESLLSADMDLPPIEIMHYDKLGLSLEFELDNEYELINIAISEGDYSIKGKTFIGKTFAELLEHFVSLGYTQFDFNNLEKHKPDEEETVYSYETGLKCWIEDMKVVEVQFSCYEEEH